MKLSPKQAVDIVRAHANNVVTTHGLFMTRSTHAQTWLTQLQGQLENKDLRDACEVLSTVEGLTAEYVFCNQIETRDAEFGQRLIQDLIDQA